MYILECTITEYTSWLIRHKKYENFINWKAFLIDLCLQFIDFLDHIYTTYKINK